MEWSEVSRASWTIPKRPDILTDDAYAGAVTPVLRGME